MTQKKQPSQVPPDVRVDVKVDYIKQHDTNKLASLIKNWLKQK